jgi:hypothetical protein
MPVEAELSPKAAARVAREAATQSFDNAVRALNIDWGTNLDGKQIQRWGEARGQALVDRHDKELAGFKKGDRPVAKPNEHELLVIGIHDGGNWIDPLWEEYFGCHERILDYYHAAEHLHEAAKAAHPGDAKTAGLLAEDLVTLLWDDKTQPLLTKLRDFSAKAGEPAENDPAGHPRKVLSRSVGYFGKHRRHIDYPEYRAKGWPIGSGITESGVKLFGKRVKGTEQFWNVKGAEAILALRGKWLSEDEESKYYWLGRDRKALAA